jgi:glycosyltransferase involved in cell wall biosynthesis
MQFSVIVPTLNGREHLVTCLDAIAAHAPAAEVIVVNGPSVDGTTGMIRERDDVDVLVEIDERNINVARNAGLDRASGDIIAFVDYWLAIEQEWADTIRSMFDSVAQAHRASGHGPEPPEVITGPVYSSSEGDVSTATAERRTIRDQRVTYFEGGNVIFRREILEDIDGFDEYLATGGARDAAHRLARLGYEVVWQPGLGVRQLSQPHNGNGISEASELQSRILADGGQNTRDWCWKYRSLTYRLVKNYGVRSLWRVVRHAATDAGSSLPNIARGDTRPSGWLANGRNIAAGSAIGLKDSLIARLRDQTPRHNHRGLSSRADRAVAVYDRR